MFRNEKLLIMRVCMMRSDLSRRYKTLNSKAQTKDASGINAVLIMLSVYRLILYNP